MKWSATAWQWLSIFLQKALGSRVKRRIDIRIVRPPGVYSWTRFACLPRRPSGTAYNLHIMRGVNGGAKATPEPLSHGTVNTYTIIRPRIGAQGRTLDHEP